MASRLEVMEERMNARMAHIEGDVNTLKHDVDTLKHDVDTLKRDVDTLKRDVGTLKEDVHMLKADVHILKQDVAEIKSGLGGVFDQLGEMRWWMIGTAVSTVVGIAAFNAAVLGNMQAAFESGRNMSQNLAQAHHEVVESMRLLREEGIRAAESASAKRRGGS